MLADERFDLDRRKLEAKIDSQAEANMDRRYHKLPHILDFVRSEKALSNQLAGLRDRTV